MIPLVGRTEFFLVLHEVKFSNLWKGGGYG